MDGNIELIKSLAQINRDFFNPNEPVAGDSFLKKAVIFNQPEILFHILELNPNWIQNQNIFEEAFEAKNFAIITELINKGLIKEKIKGAYLFGVTGRGFSEAGKININLFSPDKKGEEFKELFILLIKTQKEALQNMRPKLLFEIYEKDKIYFYSVLAALKDSLGRKKVLELLNSASFSAAPKFTQEIIDPLKSEILILNAQENENIAKCLLAIGEQKPAFSASQLQEAASQERSA